MAKRIPQLDALTGLSTASDDQFIIFDTSTDITKRISRSELSLAMSSALAVYFLPLTGGTLTGPLNVVTSSSNAALRVTQTGSGNAITVEDSANPDTTPFVVKADGKVGVGTDAPSVSVDIQTLDAVRMPSGYDGDRPTGAAGLFRYSLTANNFEGHNGTAWFPIGSMTTGTTPIANGTNGKLLYNNNGILGELTTLDVARGGSGANSLTGYLKGNGTSAMTGVASIPATDITGLGTMASQNSNSVGITGGSATLSSATLTTGTISTSPTNPNDIVNKAYADANAAGLTFHEAVALATTAALPSCTYFGTLHSGVNAYLEADANGALTIDSQSVSAGQRILVKDQADLKTNGVYVVSVAGTSNTKWRLTRSKDTETAGTGIGQLGQGDFFLVAGTGSTNNNKSWVQQTPNIDFGVSNIVFVQFAAPVTYSNGTGLSLIGTQFSIANTAVTVGSYGSSSQVASFTTNAQGQLVAAANVSIAIDTSQVTTGILSNARGGTGFGSYTAGDILYANSLGALVKLPIDADGKFLKISGGLPIWGTSPFVYPSAGIAVSSGSAWGTSLTAPSGAIVGTTDTQTLTNKRINPRSIAKTGTSAGLAAASPDAAGVINSDNYEVVTISLYSTASPASVCLIPADSGTPVEGQKLIFRIIDNGTTQYFSFATGVAKGYRWVGMSPQTITTPSKVLYLGAFYNASAQRWDIVAIAQEA